MFRSLSSLLFLSMMPSMVMGQCFDVGGVIGGVPNVCVCTPEMCDQAACEAASGLWVSEGCDCSCVGTGGGSAGDDDDDGTGGGGGGGGTVGGGSGSRGCFSGDTTVLVAPTSHRPAGGGVVAMKDLRVGDRVQTSSGTFEPVYAFGHRDTKNSLEFVKIFFQGAEHDQQKNFIELSQEHLVYVDGKKSAVRADTVKVGDSLLLVMGATSTAIPAPVTKTTKVHKTGMYAPLTSSGTILVNGGIKASTYVALHTKSKSDTEEIKIHGYTVPFMSQDLGVHLIAMPIRFVCSTAVGNTAAGTAFCQGDWDTSDTGYNPLLAWGLKIIEWAEDQSVWMQLGVFLIALVVFGFLNLVEPMVMTTLNNFSNNPSFVRIVAVWVAFVIYNGEFSPSSSKKRKKVA